jgi:serine/threonine protein phosphatase PrpC
MGAADTTKCATSSGPRDLGRGCFFLDRRELRLPQPGTAGAASAAATGATATVVLHVLQYQPTDRPIEDRYSIDLRTRPGDESTLLLGVYDGHRGASAADFASRALPSAVLTAVGLEDQADRNTETHVDIKDASIQAAFENFDNEMLSSFQSAYPLASQSDVRRRSGFSSIFSKVLKRRDGKDDSQPVALQAEHTEGALRIISGCTAAMLLLRLPEVSARAASSKIISLGDSRVVVASMSPDNSPLATSMDVNSSTAKERDLMVSQHPQDDPADLFVGVAFSERPYRRELSAMASTSFQYERASPEGKTRPALAIQR